MKLQALAVLSVMALSPFASASAQQDTLLLECETKTAGIAATSNVIVYQEAADLLIVSSAKSTQELEIKKGMSCKIGLNPKYVAVVKGNHAQAPISILCKGLPSQVSASAIYSNNTGDLFAMSSNFRSRAADVFKLKGVCAFKISDEVKLVTK